MLTVVPILDDLRQLTRSDGRPDRQIAIAAGIHPATFSAFMAGKRGLSVETAEKLGEVLGHPVRVDKSAKPPKPRK